MVNNKLDLSDPQEFTKMNENIYFIASGSQLWKSDGTNDGTTLIKHVDSGSGWGISGLINVNETLYFIANDGVHGNELWRSDGTGVGTFMIKDIHTENTDHFSGILASTDELVYFIADDGTHGYELWRSDGTVDGTFIAKDIHPGKPNTSLSFLTKVNNKIYLKANDGIHGEELWESDGTEEGTKMIKDINPGIYGSNYIYSATVINEIIYFVSDDGTHGQELWRSDQTEEGTKLLADLYPGEISSMPSIMGENNGVLFFSVEDGIHGRELWKFDPKYQTISFDPITDKVANDGPFTINATSYSGLPVLFSVISGPATVNDNIVTLTGSGQVTIRASQEGNLDFNPATPVNQSFNVVKADQTITFDAIDNKTYENSPFTLVATASSGLPVAFLIVSGPATINENTLTITGVGEIIIRTSQEGNSYFNPATSVDQSFSVIKADQTITFSTIDNKTYGDSPFSLTASASSGLPVGFLIVSGPAVVNENTLTITGVGEVTVRASQEGNEIYNGANYKEVSFNIGKAMQTITFTKLEDKIIGDAPFELFATSSSGLPITFSILSGSASLTNNIIEVTSEGEVSVRASQEGNNLYLAAEDIEWTFTVLPVLGIESPVFANIEIFPVPSDRILTVKLPLINDPISITLYNSKAEIVYKVNVQDKPIVEISVDELKPGIYFLNLSSKKAVINKKVLIGNY